VIVWNALLRIDAFGGWLVDWFCLRVYGAPIDHVGVRRFVVATLEIALLSVIVRLFYDYPEWIDATVAIFLLVAGFALWLRWPPRMLGRQFRRITGVWGFLSFVGLAIPLFFGPEDFDFEHPAMLAYSLFLLGLAGVSSTLPDRPGTADSRERSDLVTGFIVLVALVPVIGWIDRLIVGPSDDPSALAAVLFFSRAWVSLSGSDSCCHTGSGGGREQPRRERRHNWTMEIWR
jgi:hypothetical protein